MLVNSGAHFREHKVKFAKETFNSSLRKIAIQMKRFPGISIWREYISSSFPTESGEYDHNLRYSWQNISCALNLTSNQRKHSGWWRRTFSNAIMKENNITLLYQFDLSASHGIDHKGWGNRKGKRYLDCRHWRVGSETRKLFLEAFKLQLVSTSPEVSSFQEWKQKWIQNNPKF